MVKRPNRAVRQKQLSLKFDDKFLFAMEFSAKRAGKTRTQFIEDAVLKSIEGTGWEAFWHASEGVRELLQLRYGNGHKTSRDEELAAFVAAHDELFFRDMAPRVAVLDALWPDISVYLDTWKKTKLTDKHEDAAKAMRAVIAKLPKHLR